MRLVHLSDTHFGTEIDTIVRALIQTINMQEPDIVILSGDITQRARSNQFQAALDFMSQISCPKKIAVPGNHDIPLYTFTRFMWPYRNYCHAFGDREQIFSYKNVTLIGLDATSPYRHTDGKLLARHAAYLKDTLRLSNQDNQIRIVICHQPLATAWKKDSSEVLLDSEKAAMLLSDAKIDLFLSGHVHVPLAVTTATAFPELKYHFILGGAGTATSWRTRPKTPNSFNVIDLPPSCVPSKIILTRYDYQYSDHRFEVSDQVAFTQRISGWVNERDF